MEHLLGRKTLIHFIMWHKLMEIFGFRERHQPPQPVVASSGQNDTSKKEMPGTVSSSQGIGKSDIPLSQVASMVQAKPTSVGSTPEQLPNISITLQTNPLFGNQLDLPKKKTDTGECFQCRVLASVLSLGLILNICWQTWRRTRTASKDIKVAVVVLNVSLIGMWATYMEKEWLRPKNETVTTKETNLSSSSPTADGEK